MCMIKYFTMMYLSLSTAQYYCPVRCDAPATSYSVIVRGGAPAVVVRCDAPVVVVRVSHIS